MPRKRLTFTVEEQTYRAVVERLDADESVDDWVREAIDERLTDDRDASGRDGDDRDSNGRDADDGATDDRDADRRLDDDYDRRPMEFVDDCAI